MKQFQPVQVISSLRRGFMLPMVLLAVALFGMFAWYFHNYRMQQIQMSSTIGNFYAATCIAEAGVSAAITEMATQFSWKTHTTTGSGGDTVFAGPLDHDNIISSGGCLHSVSGTNGTYSGRIGDWGEFKVRVGLERVAGDNPDTKTANEEFMFYRIESVGKFGKSIQKVVVILQKRILSEEYLLYDNDFLDMVLGVRQETPYTGDNIFHVGSLFGRRYVFLGANQYDKPKLTIRDVTDVSTAGGLYVWDRMVTVNGTVLDPIKNSSTLDFKLNSGGRLVPLGARPFEGDFVEKGRETNPDFAASSLDGVLRDGGNGGHQDVLEFREIFPKFALKAQAGGVMITGPGNGKGKPDTDFENPYAEVGKPANLVMLDFGDMDDGDACLGSVPAGYNGIIYSMVPLRIRGCPDRDTVIVGNEDVYVSGDFNQSSKVIQAYKDMTLLDYAPNPANNKEWFREDREWRENHPDEHKGLYRNRCKVLSRKKIWYDYTRPDFIYENELKAFIEFELCRILTDENSAWQMMRNLDGSLALSNNQASTLLGTIWKKSSLDGKTEDELLTREENPQLTALIMWLTNKPIDHRNQSDGAPRKGSWEVAIRNSSDSFLHQALKGNETVTAFPYAGVYARKYGESVQASKDFLKQKVTVKEDTGDIQASFIEICADGKVTGKERQALVEAIWSDLTESLKDDGEYSSLWDLPARLYFITRPKGRFSQFENPAGDSFGSECAKDRLMIPEMTLNAKFISSDTRNGLWKIGKTTRAIYNELGNPVPTWSAPKQAGYFRYMPQLSGILRVLGGEIFLRTDPCPPVMTGSVYQPHVRKKVFDVELMGFEDENAIPVYSIVSYTHDKLTEAQWNGF